MVTVIRAVLPILRAQKRGHIFNFSSVAGFRGDPGASSYSASKFAVEGMSEALVGEVAPHGINVTIVEPGLFRTDFLTDNSSKSAVKIMPEYDATAGYVRRLMKEWNGTQANDPRKLAGALVTLANSEQPPLRFTAGADAIQWLEDKLTSRRAEMERWRALSISLGLENAGPADSRRALDLAKAQTQAKGR
jgi:NAD(P)-dependent dehydrogenase (short-subunit alcohol dehydrogenase family)